MSNLVCKLYGGAAISHLCVFKWCLRFKNGWESLEVSVWPEELNPWVFAPYKNLLPHSLATFDHKLVPGKLTAPLKNLIYPCYESILAKPTVRR